MSMPNRKVMEERERIPYFVIEGSTGSYGQVKSKNCGW
jgi:hypothetical protein